MRQGRYLFGYRATHKKALFHLWLALAPAIIGFIMPISVFAQPASLQPEPPTTLYRHTYRAPGVFSAYENIDSVTLGGTTKYYILPDAAVNPGFDHTTSLFANVTSTFSWAVDAPATGTIADISGLETAPHYKQITWTGLGTGTIDVAETSAAPASLTGATLSTAVEVIAAPSVVSVADLANTSCQTGTPPYSGIACPNATITVNCDVLGNMGLEVTYSLNGPGAFADVGNTTVAIPNSGVLDLSAIELTHPGAYVLTIVNISDRISLKSALPPVAVGISKTFYLTPQPVTTPLRHVTNEGW